MIASLEDAETVITARWRCACGRSALWKAGPKALERHGLDPLALGRGRLTVQLGEPPVTAFDVLRQPTFHCACGCRIPVVETLEALLRNDGGVILWEKGRRPAP